MSTRALLFRPPLAGRCAVLALLALGCGKDGPPPQPPAPEPPAQQPPALLPQEKAPAPPSRPPVPAVTADQLAQEFIDDPGRAYPRYSSQGVQVTGVVSGRTDRVAQMRGAGMGRDGRRVEWTFVLILPRSVGAGELAVGERVTIRGTPASTGIGTTAIDVGEVVRE
ncbi:MAG TPA: hypothetical protein VD866_07915 [Urbifossiella sp.]|nr:hypothetical protein [Urbifossiella sp.]